MQTVLDAVSVKGEWNMVWYDELAPVTMSAFDSLKSVKRRFGGDPPKCHVCGAQLHYPGVSYVSPVKHKPGCPGEMADEIMNREQRRRAQFSQGLTPTGPQLPPKMVRVETSLHHTDTHVVIAFNQKIGDLQLTPAQCDSFIEGIQTAKGLLVAHLAKATKNG